jgi:hypothetical protein
VPGAGCLMGAVQGRRGRLHLCLAAATGARKTCAPLAEGSRLAGDVLVLAGASLSAPDARLLREFVTELRLPRERVHQSSRAPGRAAIPQPTIRSPMGPRMSMGK